MSSVLIEAKWVSCFRRTFALSGIGKHTLVAILSESQSRQVNVKLAELALIEIGARVFHISLPTPPQVEPVPVRSTGASQALQRNPAAIRALTACEIIVDCTVEGLLHAPETPEILAAGARIFMISNEHPEILERLLPDPALQPRVATALEMLRAARQMRVTSAAGTDLVIDVAGAPVRGNAGYLDPDAKVAYWPGGLCLCFPKAGTVNGTLVMAPGDVNLTFKRYLETPIRMTVERDYVTAIEGDGLDAELMRSYIAAWDERDAYAVSHVGWGMNPRARWDALALYDKADLNGTELRAFAGNFLYSTGANETAGRFTRGHFDLPLRNCTIALDNRVIVERGRLLPPLG
ncbi:MAG TPA: 2,5-dihydroxypyridine 5,6-dioxygenase [Stellaceae bacterium]|nr:2,5-dihydroxypyridine 5,6-dioxygenase [Stellaceae bacterium]